jgi:adenylosuccinate lyase
LVEISMENIALWHERDLSNSANERFTIPMSFILLDEMLNLITMVISELRVSKDKITSNLDITKGQVYSEFVLEALLKKGIPRFVAYREIQRLAFIALQNGRGFLEVLIEDSWLAKRLREDELRHLFDPRIHLGASSKIIGEAANLVKATTRKISAS